jgi:hypothetical protein
LMIIIIGIDNKDMRCSVKPAMNTKCEKKKK